LPHGLAMVLGHGVALKGCAMSIGKPTVALDRDTVTKRIAVMPLWRTVGGRRITVDCGDPHVRRLVVLLWALLPTAKHQTRQTCRQKCDGVRFRNGRDRPVKRAVADKAEAGDEILRIVGRTANELKRGYPVRETIRKEVERDTCRQGVSRIHKYTIAQDPQFKRARGVAWQHHVSKCWVAGAVGVGKPAVSSPGRESILYVWPAITLILYE
jgi:hypothetical protein